MRVKMLLQEYFDFGSKSSLKVVKEWQTKYVAIDEVLRENGSIIRRVHEDFRQLLSESTKGRKSDHTTDQIVRALIVMFLEQHSYRDTVIRIESTPFLRTFVGIGPLKKMMDFTFLSRAIKALSPTTMMAINEQLAKYAKEEKKISGESLRADSTVYETNVHHPTDSSLLWDCFRVMSRELKAIQKELDNVPIRHRFHIKKAKRLEYYIARYAKSKTKKRKSMVKKKYRQLVGQVRWIIGVSREIRGLLPSASEEAMLLLHYEDLARRVIEQTESRILRGIIFPSHQKVYSIFEPHTELIKRGKADKPIEYGHKIVLGQTVEKFISQYEVLEKRQEDNTLVHSIVKKHKDLFEEDPKTLSLDQGFYKSAQQLVDLRKRIPTVSMRKKGKLSEVEKECQSTEEFIDGQRFRAGVEGTISVLKQAFKLDRCLFKGFNTYAVSVGLAVLCHNLVLLTRL